MTSREARSIAASLGSTETSALRFLESQASPRHAPFARLRDVLRVGISPWSESRSGAVTVSARALQGGIDTLWLGEGLLTNPNYQGWWGGLEAMTELAWLSGRFPDARIGICAAVLPLRDPMWLVKEAATLDHLTEGNFVLVATPGLWPHELEYRGVDFAQRGRVFAEHLDELIDGFTEHSPLSPRPYTEGGPPLWLGGGRPTMERALALDVPFQVSRKWNTPELVGELAAEWRDRGGGTFAMRARIDIDGPTPAAGSETINLNGSAKAVATELSQFVEAGVTDVAIAPGHDEPSAIRTVDVLVEQVLPELGLS